MPLYSQSASSPEWTAGQEERLRLATRAAGIGIWEWNIRSNTMLYDPRAREICGFPSLDAITLDMARAITHPEDLPATRQQSEDALNPAIRARERYRYRLYKRDTGEIRWVEAHAEAIFDGDGPDAAAIRYVGTLQDVTEDHNLHVQLAENEARLKLAMEASGFAVWEVDTATGSVTPSPELNRICGFAEDATPTLDDYRSRYAPGARERLEKLGAEAIARGENKIEAEIEFVWPDGEHRWILLNAQSAPDEPVPGGRVIGTMIDITGRKRDHERLELVAGEMRHRVKNTLSIVQSLATQSLKNGMEIDDARALFNSRLQALSNGTELLFVDDNEIVKLDVLTHRVLQPFWNESNPFTLNIDPKDIPAPMVVPLSLILHELATNALKYGALSVPDGLVDLRWVAQDVGLDFTWREKNGPKITSPNKTGFGTRLMQHLSQSLGGTISSSFAPQGFVFNMHMPWHED